MPLFPVQPIIPFSVAGFYANPSAMQVDNNGEIISIANGGGGGGSGTVTSIIAGTGLTGGTITTSGTVALDPNYTMYFNVMNYGANSAASDNTAAFQAAINAAEAVGGTVYIPPALFTFTGTLILSTGGITIMGNNVANPWVGGYYTGAFLEVTGDIPLLSIQSQNGCILRDFTIHYSAAVTAAAEGIQISGSTLPGSATASNVGTIVENVTILFAYHCLHVYAAQFLSVTRCNMIALSQDSPSPCHVIYYENQFNSDAGTCWIDHNDLVNFNGTTFYTLTGSGIDFSHNKCACSVGFNSAGTGGTLSDYQITHNTIEGPPINAILIAGPITNVHIVANEFEVGGAEISGIKAIGVGGPSNQVLNLVVSDNVLYGTSSTGNFMQFDGCTNFVISNNVMNNTNPSSALAIQVNSTCQSGRVFGNFGTSPSQNFSTTTEFNSRGTTTMASGTAAITDPVITSGSVIIATSNATGVTGSLRISAIGSGTATVTSSSGSDAGIVGYMVV